MNTLADLVFLTNELQSPSRQRDLNLPFEFVSFGHTDGALYKHYRNQSTFYLPSDTPLWGNTVVYGGIFLINDFDFYARILDAYHLCSLSTLMRNHPLDTHHRIKRKATPIHFDSQDDFQRLKYREKEPLNVTMYVANPNQPKITKRIQDTKHNYRIVNGVDREHFKQLIREVQHGET